MPQTSPHSVALVLIVRNEETGLRELGPKLPVHEFRQLLAIDGNSTDNTVAVLESMNIPTFRQQERGLGAAMIEARPHIATDSFIFFHPDGNEDPADLPRMAALLREGADFVVASRMIKGATNEDDHKTIKLRKWANNGLAMLANLLFAHAGNRTTDVTNGFRGISTAAWDRMNLTSHDLTMDYQMVIRALKLCIPITEFPTHEGHRVCGETNFASMPTGIAELKLVWRELKMGRRTRARARAGRCRAAIRTSRSCAHRRRQRGASVSASSPRKRWIVITSINPPTPALAVVSRLCTEQNWAAVVVGDTKTPADWASPGVDFLSVEQQKQQFGDLAELIPYRHYCRKNLGYLYAIARGAELIVDTDDDNIPYPTFGHGIDRQVRGRLLRGPGWVNVYQHFAPPGSPQPTDGSLPIWPRGLPLDAINVAGTLGSSGPADCPIQQYLADNDPDVDAIYRLTHRGSYFFNRNADPIVLDRDCWVPFNSQNTAYFADAFPLLYLPCHVSFRMTDIWRSFVAQAALWRHNRRVSFHAPTVEQLRNQHDLMKDFADEVCGYLDNRRIGQTLSETLAQIPADSFLPDTAMALWRSLEKIGVVSAKEIAIIQAWSTQLKETSKKLSS